MNDLEHKIGQDFGKSVKRVEDEIVHIRACSTFYFFSGDVIDGI